jgi:hypothetical protein
MSSPTYLDAVSDALDRLRTSGYEHGPSFVNHAPMAAEAIAVVGLTDQVPAWVEQNLRVRRYHDVPARRWEINPDDPEDWSGAIGDFSRVEDWTSMFVTELGHRPWNEVLGRWWPLLLPGMNGALTHGLIRTAHAVRAVAATDAPPHLLLRELASGLGYWAARYSGPVPGTRPNLQGEQRPSLHSIETALDLLIAENAGLYAERRPAAAVPLIHSITAPAAVRLVLPHLPDEQYRSSLDTARSCISTMHSWFAGIPTDPARATQSETRYEPAELMADAIELGDEHAIKLAEVAARQYAITKDKRLLAASRTATDLLKRHPA